MVVMLTEQEAEALIERAVERALAKRPNPTAVTLKQAAEILKVSPNTARKLGLRRNGTGLIPYEEVMRVRAAKC